MLDKKTKRRVEQFTATIGVTPEYFLSKVANDWLDDKGEFTIRRILSLRQQDEHRDLGKSEIHNRKNAGPKKMVSSISKAPRVVPFTPIITAQIASGT